MPIVVSVWYWPEGHPGHEYVGHARGVVVVLVAHAHDGHRVPVAVIVGYWPEGHPVQEGTGHVDVVMVAVRGTQMQLAHVEVPIVDSVAT